jgi:hypothetical protein
VGALVFDYEDAAVRQHNHKVGKETSAVFCGEWNVGRIYEIRGGPDRKWLARAKLGEKE